jgi:hypothetical protein
MHNGPKVFGPLTDGLKQEIGRIKDSDKLFCPWVIRVDLFDQHSNPPFPLLP